MLLTLENGYTFLCKVYNPKIALVYSCPVKINAQLPGTYSLISSLDVQRFLSGSGRKNMDQIPTRICAFELHV